MLYSYNGNYPTLLPYIISLPNGSFRIGPENFTEEDIRLAGYVPVNDPPTSITEGQELKWENNDWVIVEIPIPPPPTLD